MMLIVNRHILLSFENSKKIYEIYTIFQETDIKLRRLSKLGLLQYVFKLTFLNCMTRFMRLETPLDPEQPLPRPNPENGVIHNNGK